MDALYRFSRCSASPMNKTSSQRERRHQQEGRKLTCWKTLRHPRQCWYRERQLKTPFSLFKHTGGMFQRIAEIS